MGALLLNRTCEVVAMGDDPAIVVCEPSRRTPNVWCAAIRPDPENGLRMWVKDYLTGEGCEFDGRAVVVFQNLPPGFYEARSTRTAKVSQSVAFQVTAGGEIEILGTVGDEDAVIARLNGMTPDELHDARADATAVNDDSLPVLEGSIRQVAWAETIREALVDAALGAGEDELAVRIWDVRPASWFIANQRRSTAELRERLGMPV